MKHHPDRIQRRKRFRNLLRIILAGAFILLVLSFTVWWSGSRWIVTSRGCPQAQAAVVLGAGVKPNEKLSDMLADRVKTGIELYKNGKVDKLLMTGDHGRVSYDEVNAMRKFAEARGVPTEDIFMDHAGFCTYDSMYRAKAIFQVDSAIIITQKFHLPRSIFLARSMGMEASGVTADKQKYRGAMKFEVREVFARIQDLVRAKITQPKPKYLGTVIPITGDGRATHG